jgi:hypothetical protein
MEFSGECEAAVGPAKNVARGKILNDPRPSVSLRKTTKRDINNMKPKLKSKIQSK